VRRLTRVAVALIVGALSIGAVASRAAAQAAGERITDYQVEMQLQPSGTLSVVEQIAYDFGTASRHGIYRDLVERETYDENHDRTYDINNVSVTADGGPANADVSHNGPYLRVRIGDPDVVISGAHTYEIRYDVDGATRTFPDHQELYWDPIGNQWPVPINQARVTVAAPASITDVACYAGPQNSRLACDDASARGDTAAFTQANLGPNEGVTIVVGLPPGSIASDPQPILERRRTLADGFAARPNTLVPALLLGILAIGWVLRLAWKRGRDRRFAGSATDAAFGNDTGADEPVGLGRGDPGPVEFIPPNGVLPGQVGTLVDEHANLIDVTATIVDLAVRGWLTITDLDKDYELTASPTVGKGTLLPYETALMNALFGAGPNVKLSDLKYKFRAQLAEIQGAMYDDVVTQGWYRIRPDRTRQRWVLIGLGLLIAAVAITYVVAVASSFGLIPIALVLAAITLLVVAHRMPARTAKGTAMFSRVRGFRRLFDEGDQGLREKFAEEHDIFSRYLPYAIVFGCTDRWARVFADLDAQQLDTGWYRGNAPFNAVLLASSMNHFGTVATGTLYASQPSSSSSSGFGGGFSGGGGGGGGGGSW
jgi:hypothetical protein